MIVHTVDGRYSTLVTGMVSMTDFARDTQRQLLLLTIKDPLVMRHLFMVHSVDEVEVDMSLPVTWAEIAEGHKTGEMVSVLMFAGVVPFIWNGEARFLVLRKLDADGKRWERIGGGSWR
jgi:hypothetical protein